MWRAVRPIVEADQFRLVRGEFSGRCTVCRVEVHHQLCRSEAIRNVRRIARTEVRRGASLNWTWGYERRGRRSATALLGWRRCLRATVSRRRGQWLRTTGAEAPIGCGRLPEHRRGVGLQYDGRSRSGWRLHRLLLSETGMHSAHAVLTLEVNPRRGAKKSRNERAVCVRIRSQTRSPRWLPGRCSAISCGRPRGTRTPNPLIKSQLLYQLS